MRGFKKTTNNFLVGEKLLFRTTKNTDSNSGLESPQARDLWEVIGRIL